MSAPRCGYCGAPTLNGSLCKRDWRELQQLLRRCDGLDADLASAVGKRGRYGENTRGGSGAAPGLPINADAMAAGDRLRDALGDARRRLGLVGRASSIDCAAASILSRPDAVLSGAVGPILRGELEGLVPAAVRATDRPRSRLAVRVPCPRCGGGPLQPVMGALRCSACREQSTISEVRAS